MKLLQVMYKFNEGSIEFGVVTSINLTNVVIKTKDSEVVAEKGSGWHKCRDYKMADIVRADMGFAPVTIVPKATVEELASGDWTPNADGSDPAAEGTDEDEEHL